MRLDSGLVGGEEGGSGKGWEGLEEASSGLALGLVTRAPSPVLEILIAWGRRSALSVVLPRSALGWAWVQEGLGCGVHTLLPLL